MLRQYDEALKLRKGHRESLLHGRKKLLEALELISKTNETTAQSLQIVSERAASLWVACGGKRCQLLVAVNNPNYNYNYNRVLEGAGRPKSVYKSCCSTGAEENR
jgi:hypothetical protein